MTPPIPVLLYHSVSARDSFAVAPGDFVRHAEAIAGCGRTALTMSELADVRDRSVDPVRSRTTIRDLTAVSTEAGRRVRGAGNGSGRGRSVSAGAQAIAQPDGRVRDMQAPQTSVNGGVTRAPLDLAGPALTAGCHRGAELRAGADPRRATCVRSAMVGACSARSSALQPPGQAGRQLAPGVPRARLRSRVRPACAGGLSDMATIEHHERLQAPAHLGVSVVICAYCERRWGSLVAAVASAREQDPGPDEVVVIDHNRALLCVAVPCDEECLIEAHNVLPIVCAAWTRPTCRAALLQADEPRPIPVLPDD